LIAVGAAGAGTVGTFVDGSNAGGAPLLIGVGALFGYLALTGQRLTRLEAGGAKAQLARTKRVIERVATDPDVPEEIKEDLAEAVRDEQATVSAPTRRALNAAETRGQRARRYESEVELAILRCRPDLTVAATTLDRGPDLIVSGGEDRRVPVVISFTDQEFITAPKLVRQLLAMKGLEGGLLVTNRPLKRSGDELFNTLMDRLTTVVYNEESGPEQLREALDHLVPPRGN
jgi:hypothetical protein